MWEANLHCPTSWQVISPIPPTGPLLHTRPNIARLGRHNWKDPHHRFTLLSSLEMLNGKTKVPTVLTVSYNCAKIQSREVWTSLHFAKLAMEGGELYFAAKFLSKVSQKRWQARSELGGERSDIPAPTEVTCKKGPITVKGNVCTTHPCYLDTETPSSPPGCVTVRWETATSWLRLRTYSGFLSEI